MGRHPAARALGANGPNSTRPKGSKRSHAEDEQALCGGVALAMLAILGLPAPAHSHDWYKGLRSPSGIECCDTRDCRPVPYRLNYVTGREEVEANGRWWPIEHDKVLALSTPDGEAHACWRNPRGKPQFRCIVLPGMAELVPVRPGPRATVAALAVTSRAEGR